MQVHNVLLANLRSHVVLLDGQGKSGLVLFSMDLNFAFLRNSAEIEDKKFGKGIVQENCLRNLFSIK